MIADSNLSLKCRDVRVLLFRSVLKPGTLLMIEIYRYLVALFLTRSCLSGNFQVHGIFSKNVSLLYIYTDSYCTKQLNFERATYGMTARDGSF